MDYVHYIRGMVGHSKIIMNAAGVLIERDGQILLQHRSDNGEWGLIGGILEMGETYEAGALRETREETGLDVRLGPLLGIFYNPDMHWPSGDDAFVISAYYLVEPFTGEPRCDEESLEFRWFAPDALPPLFAADHREAIAAWKQLRALAD